MLHDVVNVCSIRIVDDTVHFKKSVVLVRTVQYDTSQEFKGGSTSHPFDGEPGCRECLDTYPGEHHV